MAKAFFDMSPQDVIDEVTKSDFADEAELVSRLEKMVSGCSSERKSSLCSM